MSAILFVLLLVFVIVPLFKGVIAIMRARRSARRFFDQFRQAAGAQGAYGRRTPEEQPQPKHRKKINPDDGEFVAFEDLPADSSAEQTTFTSVEIEQQIVDVEWEDIK